MTGLWIFLGIVVVLAIFARVPLMRIVTAATAQFSKLGRFVWRADPVAVYQAEVDRSADEIRHGTEGLELNRGQVSAYERRVATGEKEVARLTAKIKTCLTNNDEAHATEYMTQLKKAESQLAEDNNQLAGYKTSYENNLKKIQYARKKIEAAKEKARKLDSDLRMSKVDAETAKLASSFNVKNNTLEGLGEVEDEIQRQIDQNRAKAQVARDLSSDGVAEIEEEEAQQQQEAKAALEKMKAEMGLNK